MIEPLYSLDDFKPGRKDSTAAGWRHVHYDREAGTLLLSTAPARIETVVHYPADPEDIALIIDAETLEIVGVQIENFDPKALR